MSAAENSSCLILQSKLHLLQHDRGFLQSNLSYLTELGKKVSQHAEGARAVATERVEAHAAEAACRQRIGTLRESLTEAKLINEQRSERSTALGHQVSDLKVSPLLASFSCVDQDLLLPRIQASPYHVELQLIMQPKDILAALPIEFGQPNGMA